MTEELTPDQISNIIDEVVRQLRQSGIGRQSLINSDSNLSSLYSNHKDTVYAQNKIQGNNGIFQNIEEALDAAETAQKQLIKLSLSKRKDIIQSMRDYALKNAERLAKLAHEETGLGRYEDKIKKNILSAAKTPGVEDLENLTVSYTGDDGLTLVEGGAYGVIGAITPVTNPTSTIFNNSISMVSAGNSVVFNPHPSAKECTNEAIQVLNQGIIAAGGPSNLLCSTSNPTLESSQALMNAKKVQLLCVTGGGGVVKAAMISGKKCIAAGPGNPPVIVDDTAIIPNAAKHIVDGASFDNNILCTDEKEVFVFNNVADYLIEEMKRHGAYELSNQQIDAVMNVCFENPHADRPDLNRKWIGKNADLILAEAGIQINDPKIRLIIAQVDFNHPFIQKEMMMPVLGIVRVNDIHQALDYAIKAEHHRRHTAMMHSESVSNLTLVAKNMDVTIFVKNASNLAGLGLGGEGYHTMTIAGPTGEGLTRARTFTRQRRCVLVGGFRII